MATAVLVGFAESLAAIESAWMLRAAGFEVHAFTRRGSRPALRHSKGIHLHEVTSPQDDAEQSAGDIVALAGRLGVAVVMPLDDEAVWLTDRADHRVEARVAGPVGAQSVFALDKRDQLAAATAAGFSVPPTMTVSGGERHGALPHSDGGWFVKPALALRLEASRLTKGRAALVRSREELEQDLSARREPVLVQARLDGVGEGVFGLATTSGVVQWSGHRRVRMMNPAGSGASACRAVPVRQEAVTAAERLVAATSWSGLFMVELLVDADDTAWFMEVNGRTWGSMALARRRGLLYPAWAAQEVLGLLDPAAIAQIGAVPAELAPSALVRHVGRELVHLAMVARGPQDGGGEWPGLGRSVREVLRWGRDDRAYNLRPGETLTWLADIATTILSQARSLVQRPR